MRLWRCYAGSVRISFRRHYLYLEKCKGTIVQEGNTMAKHQRLSRRMFLGGGIGVAGLVSNVLALSTGPQGKQGVAYASSHIPSHTNSSMADMAGMAGIARCGTPPRRAQLVIFCGGVSRPPRMVSSPPTFLAHFAGD